MKHRNSAKFDIFSRWYGLLLLMLFITSTVKAQKEICQPRPTDIVFILDGSRSVRPWHFKSTTDAVKDMVDEFDILGPDDIQVGLIQYGSLVKQEFALGQYSTKEEVNEAIDGIEYMAGGTMTGAALRFLVTRTFTKQEGARMSPHVAKIAVIITDGRAQDADGVDIWQQKVKDAGIEVFAIGVGRRIQDADLLLMASEPKEKHKFYVRNFDLIQNLHLLLKDEICVMEVDECAEDTDGCDHICTNTIGSYFCECRSGFELQEDDRTCQYYDPCENAGCQHICEAAPPSRGFRCMCRDGFVLNRDERTCSAKKPASPVNLEFSDITHKSMRVSWELDEPERASSVEYYTVEYEHGDTGEVLQKKVYEPEAVLDDLTPGTEYTVSVKSHGDGLESAPISGKETTLFLGDTKVALSNPSLTSLFATWDPAGGDLLSGYKVQVTKLGEDGETSEVSNHDVSSEQHEMKIDGLTSGQSYRVTVTPMHGKIQGAAGSDDGTTLSLKEPDVLVTDTTYRSAVVEWTGIGGPADYFTVTLFSSSLDEELQQNVSGNSHSVVFTGLNPATEYTALVSGHVGELSSGDGTARGRTKSPETPSVSVIDTGLTTMEVIWTVSGRYPDKFEVEWYPVGDSANKQSLVTEDISLNLKYLEVGTEYEINVVAVYLEEEPIKSSKGTTTATTDYPPAPVVEITDTGLLTLDAEWSVDGIQPSSYLVDIIDTYRSNIRSLKTENTSMTFTDLIPTREYLVEVRGVYDDTKSDSVGEIISEPGKDTGWTKFAPTPEVLYDTGLGTLEVSWTYDALEVDDFVVAVEGSGRDRDEVVTTEYSHKFTGLEPGTTYQVGVVARYHAGWVPESLLTLDEFGVALTKSLEAPIVTADALSWTTGTVNWTGIGMPAAQFKVEYSYDGADPVSNDVNGSYNTATLTDLDQDKEYVATVTGIVVEDGRTFISPPGHDTFSIGPVPEPEVNITSTGLTTAQVSWSPSSSPDLSKPTGYQVTYFHTNDPKDSQTFNTEETSAALSGLAPGTEYTVEVVALYHDPNLHGSDFESTPGRDQNTTKSLSAPDVKGTVTSPTTAQIDWTSNIDYEVALWRIEYTPKGSESPPMIQEVWGNITSIDLADLVRDAEYDVSVYGIAEESGIKHTSPPGVDDFVMKIHSPPNVNITKTGLQMMQVLWTVEGEYPSKFIGRYYPTNDPDNSEIFTTEDISYKLTGLEQDTSYTVEIASVYTEDDITVTTDPGSDMDKTKRLHAPNVTTTGSTYTTADIEWTGIGVPADWYEVEFKPTDSDEEPLGLRVAGDKMSCILDGLQHDTEYTVTVTGFVSEEEELFRSPLGKDNFKLGDIPPPNVTIIGSTTTTLNATWDTDVDADSFIVMILGEDDGSIQRFNFDGDVREHTFDSLTPGAKYTIEVRTRDTERDAFRVNEIISSAGTAKGNTKPEPPQNLKDVSAKPTDLTVSFDPPIGSYDYFEYMCVPEGTDVDDVPISRIDADASLQAVCLDVGPGVRYTVYIRTRIRDDVSDWATLDVQTTFGPPQNFNLSEPTTHTIVATWEPPEYVDTVDVYVLSYKPEDSNELPTEVEILGTERKYVIENLHPSTSYRGSIIAVVRSFRSPATDDSETTLDDDVSVSVVDTGYNTIEIEWPGSRVQGVVYALFAKPSSEFITDNSGSSITLDPGTTSAVIPRLTPATIYDIQLQYLYSTGPAAEATTSGATLAPPPGPLTFTDVANTEFAVHWGKPGFGAEPIGYIVTYVGPEPGEIVTQPDGGDTLDWKFDSMYPGTTYNVSVIARYQNGIESEPVHGQVTTRPREQRQCSCNDYMDKQDDMQRTVEKLVGVIEALNARIGSLEESLTASAQPEGIERSPPDEQ